MFGVARIALVACVGLPLAFPIAPAQAESADDPLIGIWASEMTFGPALRGELTVAQTGASWRASMSTAETSFHAAGGAITFVFPDNRGQFRGALTEGGRAITGFWLQPSGATADRPNPPASSQAFATPLVLRRAGPGIWRGTVRPLDERFTLYLKIYRNAEGLLTGAFRNPEINSNGGASLFRVAREGDQVLLTARPYDTQPEIHHSAILPRAAPH